MEPQYQYDQSNPRYNQQYQYYVPQKQGGFFKGCLQVLGMLTLIFVCLIGLLIYGISKIKHSVNVSNTPKDTATTNYEYISGEKNSDNCIAVIEINGVISNQTISFNNAGAKSIIRLIQEANQNSSVKAIILNLDTPGGEVTAADEIYHELTLVKKPVIAMMNSMAASGGYYISMAADKIVANELTMTGSIGVIMESINFHELSSSIGIKAETYASGKMKTMLNPLKETTKEEADIINELVNNTYKKFVGIVSKARNIPEKTILEGPIGDGRVFDGKQALALNLIDKTGYFSDAEKTAAELAKLKEGDYHVSKITESLSFSDALGLLLAKNNISISSEIAPVTKEIKLQSGKLYFLPSIF